jgi:hypothetical protein
MFRKHELLDSSWADRSQANCKARPATFVLYAEVNNDQELRSGM